MKHLAATLAGIIGLVVLSGCATEAPPPSPAPAVVTSVETTLPGGTALTVAVGADRYRIYNVLFGQAGSFADTCEAASDTAVARRLLVGRTIADVEHFERWDDPDRPADYSPAELRFVAPDRSNGDDLRSEFSRAAADARSTACPRERYTGPLSDEAYPSGGSDVYVDGGGDGDGESRFCGRRWYC